VPGARARRRKLGKERLEARRVVRQAMLGQLAVSGEDCDLRHTFVEVDAHVYHAPGLLSQRAVLAPLRCEPISGWAGGQRTYGISNWATTPTTWFRSCRQGHYVQVAETVAHLLH
jgi:hypothetical protein